MSKGGGAGKVYFILYLAVLLELLIIIVERDDAEDELRKEKLALEAKSKRIQLIAETIINSLRGTATSVSSTSDQTMVMGDEKEANGRDFSVRVRVADPIKDSVKELDLHILRNDQEMASFNIATDSNLYPRVREGQDYIFKYNFKPSYGEGQYKLRFDAKTNQIVGVTPQASGDDTVKIGAVHLTVNELREVKDGITENVALKGYIDSLLGGNYENFATNIGSNEFSVNVKKKAATVYDQLSVFPEENDFVAFPGLQLPNPVKIQGAETKGVTMSKINGPGEFTKVDTNWVWSWKPDANAVGQTYTVTFKGQTNRGGGSKDVATSQFSVRVNKLEPAVASRFSPENPKTHVGTPYTRIPFKANGNYANLVGAYKMELYLNGVKIKEANEPNIEFTPEFLKDEGKTLEVKDFFKSAFMKDYIPLDDQTFKIQYPPLIAPDPGELTAGDQLDFKAALGVPGNFSEIGGDLEISSDGYFDTRAKKVIASKTSANYEFIANMTSKANNIKSKSGQPVPLIITDPITHQSKTYEIRIMPKVVTKGGGPARGGGGIH